MKRIVAASISVVLTATAAWSQPVNTNKVQSTQQQSSMAVGGGNADSVSTAIVGDNMATAQGGVGWSNSTSEGGTGVAWSDGDSAAVVDIDSTSISRYHNHTPPMTTYPPYLPLWNHGGWGTINAYFPNGPAVGDGAYQRSFNPSDPEDMRELRRMLTSIPYDGPLNMLGGVLRGVAAAFGGPDYYHRGRGFEIANALVRDRRPQGKPLVVFIDSLIDPQLLKDNGYAYVGRISLEGKWDRNWDQVYNAAIAEALPWDVDVLLIAGGMKGVTVGSNTSFPSAALGYAQEDHSLSLFGGSARASRRARAKRSSAHRASATARRCSRDDGSPRTCSRRSADPRLRQRAWRRHRRRCPRPCGPRHRRRRRRPRPPSAPGGFRDGSRRGPGIEVSKELYNMAGFNGQVDNVMVK